MRTRIFGSVVAAVTLAVAVVGAAVSVASPAWAGTAQLKRYPYLTDAGKGSATVNFGTDRSQTTGAYVRYGRVGSEACTAHRVTARGTYITVNGVPEEQWKAVLTGLSASTSYCYRVFLPNPVVDLLGPDPSPQFSMPPAMGSAKPFSFAVIGDWGRADANGNNLAEARLMQQISASGAQFIVGAGDTGYPGGSETNYGDLFQAGSNVSAVFGPSFYPQVGKQMPMFNTVGNHGNNATFPLVWPEKSAAASSYGRYQIDRYCVPGTTCANYPSAWYAFNAGRARFYILDAAWSNTNVGSGSLYSDDYLAHWAPGSAEVRWLAQDLAAHPGGLKIAVLHFPMYSDNSSETTDTYMHGPGSVGELLSQNGVQLVFNGHGHIYQRNTPSTANGESFVSYVSGGGGATLETIGTKGCSVNDAYGIGWSPSKLKGYACGAAPVPTSASQVYSFLKVSVTRGSVTVRPTDSMGRTFDVQTYDF